jgi:hypothetical protein
LQLRLGAGGEWFSLNKPQFTKIRDIEHILILVPYNHGVEAAK